jgi:hypothetical protein
VRVRSPRAGELAAALAATEHLVLRRMTNDDAAALVAYRSDPVQAR